MFMLFDLGGEKKLLKRLNILHLLCHRIIFVVSPEILCFLFSALAFLCSQIKGVPIQAKKCAQKEFLIGKSIVKRSSVNHAFLKRQQDKVQGVSVAKYFPKAVKVFKKGSCLFLRVHSLQSVRQYIFGIFKRILNILLILGYPEFLFKKSSFTGVQNQSQLIGTVG